MIDTVYKAIAWLNNASEGAAPMIASRLEHIDKIIDIDQSPIGRTPRSNPATYTGASTLIREWFAGLPEAKGAARARPLLLQRQGGRCEACQGDGVIKIEMHFARRLVCDTCKGKANRETLEVLFKGKASPTCSTRWKKPPNSRRPRVMKPKTLHRVGLDYIHVG